MKTESPEDLVRRCQQTLPEDTRAFEEIVSRYKRKVFYTAYRLLDNREEAEDYAQEIFLKIYRNIKTLSEPATFEGWLHRITVNTCLNAIEKRKRTPAIKIHLDADEENQGFDIPSKSNTEKKYEAEEIRNCLEKALAKLEPTGRNAIVLRDIEEMSYEEIASSLKLGLSAVKMRIHRARLAVRDLIEKICPGSWRASSVR
ncbi:MAG TPA: sigma-70 family RNA polymerase sigma factor [Pyrinomonadaceae bacterium]|nr:sigma-70 family RNA polymerase sigma factor [Pyrinomonadaceae bacterium]